MPARLVSVAATIRRLCSRPDGRKKKGRATVRDAPETTIRELVAELERRFPYAAAHLRRSSGTRIEDSGSEQHATQQHPTQGIVFTIYDGTTFRDYATSELAPDPLARAVRQWAAGLRPHPGGAPVIGGGYATIAGRDPRIFHTAPRLAPERIPLAEKLAHIRSIQRRAKDLDRRAVQVTAAYGDGIVSSLYIGRGRHLEQHLTRTTLALMVVVAEGQQVRTHMLTRGGTAGYEVAEITDDEITSTVETALRLLNAEHIEPATYDVITDPSISGVIAHESFGHGVELDLFPKHRARAAGYLQQRVAAPGVDLFDDPSRAGAYGSYFFDDEGELARPTHILRDGVFVSPISDFASATLAPGPHTPNGRRQDFTRKVYARMSNTFFAPGALTPEELIAGVERGIYLRSAESGMEDPLGWGVQVTAHYGEEIINGRLTGRLFAPIGITGYVPDLLRSITAVGSDFELTPGVCGKGTKEMVPVSTGGPHMRMRARLG